MELTGGKSLMDILQMQPKDEEIDPAMRIDNLLVRLYVTCIAIASP